MLHQPTGTPSRYVTTPGGVRPITQGAHRLLAVPLAEFRDVLGPQSMRQTPTVRRAPVGIDDVGEVLETV
jgi:hypothetical protein